MKGGNKLWIKNVKNLMIKALYYIQSYLNNRKQNNNFRSWQEIIVEVSKGSNLVPLLF